MSTTVTDEQIQQLAATAEPYSLALLSWGSERNMDGGSWVTHDVRQLGCAHRHKVPPDTYSYSIGFRVAYSES